MFLFLQCFYILLENNDDYERMARRRSRLLQPHPDVVNSPAHDAARKAAVTQAVPRNQVGEHYGNCIRLAAENKITSKNAFDLHLIDYMGEVLKKEDFTSFRVSLISFCVCLLSLKWLIKLGIALFRWLARL